MPEAYHIAISARRRGRHRPGGLTGTVAAVAVCAMAVSLTASGNEAFWGRDRSIKISQVESGGYLSLIVQNLAAYDATVTLRIRSDNRTVLRLKPETDTYPAGSVTEAARLSAAMPGQRWMMRYRFHWVKGDIHAQHDTSVFYRLPYQSGTSHRVSQGYNGRTHRDHDQYAVDFAMREGTVVCAARDGVVVDLKESFQTGGPEKKYEEQSNFVSIAHADGTIAEYHHLQYEGVLVEIGQRVKAGAQIALSGNTGYSSQPHLHFGVYSVADGRQLQSHPVTFTTLQGTLTEPLPGRIYTAR